MFSYVKVLCVTKISQRKSLKNVTCFFVSIETVSGSGYYGIECLYRIIHDLKTPLFLVAWILEVKTKRLTLQCSIRLARHLCSSTSLVTFSCYRTVIINLAVKGLMNLTLSGNHRTIEILNSSPCVTND